MSFGARLVEERKRLGYKQVHFAVLVGSDAPKQSLYENGHRALRAGYLARIDAAGVDVRYVLTGRRSEGVLGEEATAFLCGWLDLPTGVQDAVRRLIDNLGRHPGEHSPKGGT